MTYYDTIEEDLARAKEILRKGAAAAEMSPDIHLHLEGGTIYGADTYAAYKLLESFVAEIERLRLTESRFERITTDTGKMVTDEYFGPLDEVVAVGAWVHLEAMNDSAHCLIIEAGGERLCLNIGAKKAKVESTISWREQVRTSAMSKE